MLVGLVLVIIDWVVLREPAHVGSFEPFTYFLTKWFVDNTNIRR